MESSAVWAWTAALGEQHQPPEDPSCCWLPHERLSLAEGWARQAVAVWVSMRRWKPGVVSERSA